MTHKIRSNADEIINTIPELFIKQRIVFNFVYFSSGQTLGCTTDNKLSPNWPSFKSFYYDKKLPLYQISV